MSELQQLQAFLKGEVERVRGEIESALAGEIDYDVRIIEGSVVGEIGVVVDVVEVGTSHRGGCHCAPEEHRRSRRGEGGAQGFKVGELPLDWYQVSNPSGSICADCAQGI
jgi:hypothetical protein